LVIKRFHGLMGLPCTAVEADVPSGPLGHRWRRFGRKDRRGCGRLDGEKNDLVDQHRVDLLVVGAPANAAQGRYEGGRFTSRAGPVSAVGAAHWVFPVRTGQRDLQRTDRNELAPARSKLLNHGQPGLCFTLRNRAYNPILDTGEPDPGWKSQRWLYHCGLAGDRIDCLAFGHGGLRRIAPAMEEDCSMMRVLDEDDEICQEEQDYEVADMTLTPLPDGEDLDLSFASGGDPWGGVDYAQLAQRVYKARTVERHYLTAGMMESEI